jgi:hypothetical protein
MDIGEIKAVMLFSCRGGQDGEQIPWLCLRGFLFSLRIVLYLTGECRTDWSMGLGWGMVWGAVDINASEVLSYTNAELDHLRSMQSSFVQPLLAGLDCLAKP